MVEHSDELPCRGLFILHQGIQRRIRITILHEPSSDLQWTDVRELVVGKCLFGLSLFLFACSEIIIHNVTNAYLFSFDPEVVRTKGFLCENVCVPLLLIAPLDISNQCGERKLYEPLKKTMYFDYTIEQWKIITVQNIFILFL